MFNKKNGFIPSKLFLLHITICYINIYLKLSKYLENNEELFALIFDEIFLIPFIHNFDKAYKQLMKKIDLLLFGNSEYISSMMVDLESNEIISDIGILFQKNYYSSFLNYKNKKKIVKEIIFQGECLKNNYLKTNDKNLDKIENCIKLELRATFPKPLFIIKFFPILKGIVIVHLFYQYKLSKIQIKNKNNPNSFIYDKYKEIDIIPFNLFNQLEAHSLEQIKNIEHFFFEYFFILENNCKKADNISNSQLMTYKNIDYNLVYIHKDILKIIRDIVMEYYKDEKDLIYKLKRNFINNNESEYIKNNNINNNEVCKDPLEFNYNDFIKEFETNPMLKTKKNNNELVDLSDINVMMPGDFSNINEYSELNLSKANFGKIKKNIVKTLENNNDCNIYNNYGIITTETKYLKTEADNEEIPNNANEPFNVNVTNILNNGEISKDEWGFKSILIDKNK